MLKLCSHIVRLGTLSAVRRYASTSTQALDSLLKGMEVQNQEELKNGKQLKKPTGLVAAVFANLNNEDDDKPFVKSKSQPQTSGSMSYFELRKVVDKKITTASDLHSLLSIVDSDILTRNQALKIVSILSEWSSAERVNTPEFENDPRFLRLCRMLGRQRQSNQLNMSTAAKNSEDLNTVISVAGDDEAARLVASLSDKQMIKVMSALAQKKRRSPALLRTLSYHITKSSKTLDLKSCGDLLYAMASLSYPDTVLFDKIFGDIQETLPQNKEKSSVLGSIVTSVGMLKCKDREILDIFTDWMVEHSDVTRIQDVAALVMTLGVVGYSSMNVDKLPKLSKLDFSKPSGYLDYVWALVVLNLASSEQIATVLSHDFLESLKVEKGYPPSLLKKLLNINSYAVLVMSGYRGPFLDDEISNEVVLTYSKEKAVFIASLLDTLKSLLSSGSNLKTGCNSKMGFLYDAECLLDSKCNPYPVDSPPPKGKTLTKVVMLGLEYHDVCRQTNDPVGSIVLYKQLLEAQGYKVLLVPYTEYNSRDRLVNRVQYIERKLKEIVQSN